MPKLYFTVAMIISAAPAFAGDFEAKIAKVNDDNTARVCFQGPGIQASDGRTEICNLISTERNAGAPSLEAEVLKINKIANALMNTDYESRVAKIFSGSGGYSLKEELLGELVKKACQSGLSDEKRLLLECPKASAPAPERPSAPPVPAKSSKRDTST